MCTLYERIQSLCKNKGVSASRMCLDLGLSKSTMSDMKNGRKSGISVPTAQKIAAYFDVPVEYLLTGEYPNGYCPPDDENPYILEVSDIMETMEIDTQIAVVNTVRALAADHKDQKNIPGEETLTEDEKALLELFRQVPEDRRSLVLNMIRTALQA